MQSDAEDIRGLGDPRQEGAYNPRSWQSRELSRLREVGESGRLRMLGRRARDHLKGAPRQVRRRPTGLGGHNVCQGCDGTHERYLAHDTVALDAEIDRPSG